PEVLPRSRRVAPSPRSVATERPDRTRRSIEPCLRPHPYRLHSSELPPPVKRRGSRLRSSHRRPRNATDATNRPPSAARPTLGLMPEQHGAFGQDSFGRTAERAARFFGTPQYIIGQTIVVIIWIALNSVALISHWDAYPFILLNLAFSTQAAYAAPLILLAETRQAARDKTSAD